MTRMRNDDRDGMQHGERKFCTVINAKENLLIFFVTFQVYFLLTTHKKGMSVEETIEVR